MTRPWYIGLAVAVALVLAGCAPLTPVDPDTLAVQDVVRAYNDALIVGFAEMDMNALNAVATEEQATKEFYLMAALGEGRLQMFSTLQSIEFGDVEFPSDGAATVTTTETWDYEHVSLDTSETVRAEQGVLYRLRYDLVLQDGRWLVADVVSLDDESSGDATGAP